MRRIGDASGEAANSSLEDKSLGTLGFPGLIVMSWRVADLSSPVADIYTHTHTQMGEAKPTHKEDVIALILIASGVHAFGVAVVIATKLANSPEASTVSPVSLLLEISNLYKYLRDPNSFGSVSISLKLKYSFCSQFNLPITFGISVNLFLLSTRQRRRIFVLLTGGSVINSLFDNTNNSSIGRSNRSGGSEAMPFLLATRVFKLMKSVPKFNGNLLTRFCPRRNVRRVFQGPIFVKGSASPLSSVAGFLRIRISGGIRASMDACMLLF